MAQTLPRATNLRSIASEGFHQFSKVGSIVMPMALFGARRAYGDRMISPRLGRRLLIGLFVIVVALTGYQIVRTVSTAIYWQQHRDEPIAQWMSVGYVAHSYHVPPWVLERAIGLPQRPDHRPLGKIAADRGQNFSEIEANLKYAIVHARPPYPPPPAPAPRKP